MYDQRSRRQFWDQVRQRDLRAFDRFLTLEVVTAALLQAGIPMGRGILNKFTMIWLAIASALHILSHFKDVLNHTIELLDDGPLAPHFHRCRDRMRRSSTPKKRHDPRPDDPLTLSEEAFAQARQLLPWGLWIALILVLNDRFERVHGAQHQFQGYRLLALDGTCLRLANWTPLKAWFGTATNARKGKKSQPTVQARLVMLQFPSTRLPWRYELVPLSEGEHTVATRLLSHLRPRDLVLMDRGFFSYGAFWQILGRQAAFGVRQVAQVKIRTVEGLSDGSRLVEWMPSDPKKKWKDLPRSIRLRAIDYQVKGFRPSTLLTSVLDPAEISREEWVRMAVADRRGKTLIPAGLYHWRWGIETTFFELKCVQMMDGHLRSRTPEGIMFEVGGHLVLYLLMRWWIVEAAAEVGEPPLRISYTGALGAVKQMEACLFFASRGRAERELLPRLRGRIGSHYVPDRPDRHYPRPNDTKAKNKGKGRKQLPSKLNEGEVTAPRIDPGGAATDKLPSKLNEGEIAA